MWIVDIDVIRFEVDAKERQKDKQIQIVLVIGVNTAQFSIRIFRN